MNLLAPSKGRKSSYETISYSVISFHNRKNKHQKKNVK